MSVNYTTQRLLFGAALSFCCISSSLLAQSQPFEVPIQVYSEPDSEDLTQPQNALGSSIYVINGAEFGGDTTSVGSDPGKLTVRDITGAQLHEVVYPNNNSSFGRELEKYNGGQSLVVSAPGDGAGKLLFFSNITDITNNPTTAIASAFSYSSPNTSALSALGTCLAKITHAGTDYIIAGNAPVGEVVIINTSNLTGPPAQISSAPPTLFGSSCKNIGDINGDGTDDIAIGAPGIGTGSVQTYSGAALATGGPTSSFTPMFSLNGTELFSKFGASISGLVHAGKYYIAIGEPLSSVDSTNNSPTLNNAGEFFLYSGTVSSSPNPGAPVWSVAGGPMDGELGGAVLLAKGTSPSVPSGAEEVMLFASAPGGYRSAVSGWLITDNGNLLADKQARLYFTSTDAPVGQSLDWLETNPSGDGVDLLASGGEIVGGGSMSVNGRTEFFAVPTRPNDPSVTASVLPAPAPDNIPCRPNSYGPGPDLTLSFNATPIGQVPNSTQVTATFLGGVQNPSMVYLFAGHPVGQNLNGSYQPLFWHEQCRFVHDDAYGVWTALMFPGTSTAVSTILNPISAGTPPAPVGPSALGFSGLVTAVLLDLATGQLIRSETYEFVFGY